jgi:hypothetical protein
MSILLHSHTPEDFSAEGTPASPQSKSELGEPEVGKTGEDPRPLHFRGVEPRVNPPLEAPQQPHGPLSLETTSALKGASDSSGEPLPLTPPRTPPACSPKQAEQAEQAENRAGNEGKGITRGALFSGKISRQTGLLLGAAGGLLGIALIGLVARRTLGTLGPLGLRRKTQRPQPAGPAAPAPIFSSPGISPAAIFRRRPFWRRNLREQATDTPESMATAESKPVIARASRGWRGGR